MKVEVLKGAIAQLHRPVGKRLMSDLEMPISAMLSSVLLVGVCAKVGHGIFGLVVGGAAYLVYALTHMLARFGVAAPVAPVRASWRGIGCRLERWRHRPLFAAEASSKAP